MFVNIPLLAVTLPVTLTNLPVKLATFTMFVNMPLLAVTLPVADNPSPDINPPLEILPIEIIESVVNP